MNHNAIYALYPQVITIDDTEGAFDKDGNKVEIDLTLIDTWVNPNEYQYKRALEYPSFADQFDLLYHGGYDAWKSAIQSVKNKYPKNRE
jgi:hypothetical protein